VALAGAVVVFGWAYGSRPSPATELAMAGGGRLLSTPSAQESADAFAEVAARLAPSVVRITTTQRSAGSVVGGNPFEGTPFERYFEEFRQSPQAPRIRQGTGSGVVIDEQGHILTNHHVVADADEVRVTFVDGREAEGKVVGNDPATDLAVIQVEETADLKPARFGDVDQMQVGEWVVAIGNPFGLDHSVTVGVLSAKERFGFAPGRLEDFLQTDASINPGNSGGPLVNLRGEVIGINTMIAGLGTGVGFAVSASMARPVASQLIQHGKVTRPYIGVVMQPLTPRLREALGGNAPQSGALVAQVQPGSPAADAQIQPGDVVVRVDGTATEDSRDVQQAVLQHEVGDQVRLTLWRNGRQVEVTVRTDELPGPEDGDTPGHPIRPGDGEEQLGIALQTLTPELARQVGVAAGTRGVVVTQVRPASRAAEAGLRQGDVIVEIDRQTVTTAEGAASRLGVERDGGHLLRVLRGEGALYLVVPG
jgi:serine protease Do